MMHQGLQKLLAKCRGEAAIPLTPATTRLAHIVLLDLLGLFDGNKTTVCSYWREV